MIKLKVIFSILFLLMNLFLPWNVLAKTALKDISIGNSKDEDVDASSVEEESGSFLHLNDQVINKYHKDANLPIDQKIKSWKFENIFNSLPQTIQSSPNLEISSDASGDYWVVNNDLFDSHAHKSIFSVSPEYDLEISEDGKYLVVRGTEDTQLDDKLVGIYRIPELSKIYLMQGCFFNQFLDQGHLIVADQENSKDSKHLIIDLKNPGKILKSFGDEDPWYSSLIFESQDGSKILHLTKDGLGLFNLPGLNLIQTFTDLPRGTPFMNGTGSLIGSNNGFLCYLKNLNTGEIKAYGLDSSNCKDLVEGASIKEAYKDNHINRKTGKNWHYVNSAMKSISLSSLKTIKKYNSHNKEKLLNGEPTTSSDVCDVRYVIAPGNSPDVWVVLNRFNSAYGSDRSGESWILRVGEDLKIKRIIHVANTFNGIWWDKETNSLEGQTYDRNHFKLKIGQ